MINDIEYWKNRHKVFENKLASVGTKSYSDRANFFIYEMLKKRCFLVLEKLKLPKKSSLLDAGSGIGLFSEFFAENGFDVTASDVSDLALEKIKNPNIKKVCGEIKDLNFPEKSFDVVVSFDVLYHILKEEIWEKSVSKMCELSKNYVILHERFLKRSPGFTSKHVKMRAYSQTLAVLKKNGFEEVLSVPTHFWPLRWLVYRFSAFFPKFFYFLDDYTLRFIDKHNLKVGSHFIKVFKRK